MFCGFKVQYDSFVLKKKDRIKAKPGKNNPAIVSLRNSTSEVLSNQTSLFQTRFVCFCQLKKYYMDNFIRWNSSSQRFISTQN